MEPTLDDLTDDALRDEVTTWGGRVAAGEARLLLLVGELEARGAWAQDGVRSCAHWLSWRLGMAPGTARERVRVGRCLRELPLITSAMSRGELSWSQVRALTRVATPADEENLLGVARRCTGAQLEKLCRGVRRAQQPVETDADPEALAWRRRPQVRYDDDGDMVLTLRLPAEKGQVVLAALRQVLSGMDVPAGTAEPKDDAAALPQVPAQRTAPDHAPASAGSTEPGPAPTPASGPTSTEGAPAEDVPAGTPTPSPTIADALLRLCEQVRITDTKAKARLKVLLDPLSGWARTADGELLPPGTVHAAVVAPAQPTDLTRHDRGREERDVPGPLRALLGQVDGERCRFPGCGSTRWLHAHHVVWWSKGGSTALSNLVLVCSFHHHLIHDCGYTVELQPDRRLTVRAGDTPISWRDRALWRPAEELDPDQRIKATTLPPQWDGSGLDLDHAVWGYLHRAAA